MLCEHLPADGDGDDADAVDTEHLAALARPVVRAHLIILPLSSHDSLNSLSFFFFRFVCFFPDCISIL